MSISNSLLEVNQAVETMMNKIRKNNAAMKEQEEEAAKKIAEYSKKQAPPAQYEYLVRGATLICNKGSHKRKVNLPQCHGVYAGIYPLLHELECTICNISSFGVCEMNPPTEMKEYIKLPHNSKDGTTGVVQGFACIPVIVGTWKNCYAKTRIVDNGLKNYNDRLLATMDLGEPAKGQSTLTTESFLVCKYGGIIEPVNSGQRFY